MSIQAQKREIIKKITLLRKETKDLEDKLEELYKKDHRTLQCKHGIHSVCYACSYP